jgi:hypothetical protein
MKSQYVATPPTDDPYCPTAEELAGESFGYCYGQTPIMVVPELPEVPDGHS